MKEDDTSSVGGLLPEIETDKAQMHVGTLDHSILARVMVQKGTRAVYIISQITLPAESGDLVSLEVPQQEKGTACTSGGLARKAKVAKSTRVDTRSARREGRQSVVESPAESAPDTAGNGELHTPHLVLHALGSIRFLKLVFPPSLPRDQGGVCGRGTYS